MWRLRGYLHTMLIHKLTLFNVKWLNFCSELNLYHNCPVFHLFISIVRTYSISYHMSVVSLLSVISILIFILFLPRESSIKSFPSSPFKMLQKTTLKFPNTLISIWYELDETYVTFTVHISANVVHLRRSVPFKLLIKVTSILLSSVHSYMANGVYGI